ncbi:MAG: Tyrosine-specific transport protein [Chlamydiia bacterium]|nr:Tyrosine-specific transport protein [Chlamydiia bacterium]MCH9618302.1 Tyrosine-specific transport protein [Chlamydiia bacterium]MCH9624175.1 Tyrosine-specific transport protein [Chlamydiia bacterium]
MSHSQSGSVVGGSLLITGSCIGAGMLGLPILTGFAGLIPAIFMFLLAWALMTGTALLLVEVGGWFKHNSNFPSMINTLLGDFFKSLCFILYLLLFYTLLVAYVAESGTHFTSILKSIGAPSMAPWLGSVFFVVIFGWMIYLGTRPVDILNRFLMIFKILSFLGVIYLCLSYIDVDRLLYTNYKYTFFPLPILVISFGFHNMIPTITNYLKGDIKRVKQSILFGSILTLSIYLVWIFIALGSIPVSGNISIEASHLSGLDAAKTLALLYPRVITATSILAFTAILTSFLAQATSVTHFYCDGLKINDRKHPPFGILLLTLIPPLIIASTYPAIFYKALDFGGMIAVVLFGIFPVMMAYKGRYIEKRESPYQLFGGKYILFFLALFSSFILLNRILHHLGFEIFLTPS